MGLNVTKLRELTQLVEGVPLKAAQSTGATKTTDDQLTSADNKVATVADLPNAADNKGRMMFVSGTNRWMFSNGDQWVGVRSSDPSTTAGDGDVYDTRYSSVSASAFRSPEAPTESSVTQPIRQIQKSLINLNSGFSYSGFVDPITSHISSNNKLIITGNDVFKVTVDAGYQFEYEYHGIVSGSTYVSDWDWNTASLGAGHIAAIKADGSLWLWGVDTSGQCGASSTTATRSSPIQVAGGGTWQSISAGGYHTGGIKSGGTLWMWGSNSAGQLGNSTTISRSSPIQIAGTWTHISCGVANTTAIKTDGTIWQWGGRVGDGTSLQRSSPVQITATSGWVESCSGNAATIARKSDNTLWWWTSSPVQIAGNNWAAIGTPVATAVKTDGTAWLLDRAPVGGSTTSAPYRIGVRDDWSVVSAGIAQTMSGQAPGNLISFVKATQTGFKSWPEASGVGEGFAWGNNNFGQVGNSVTVSATVPVPLPGESSWKMIRSGYNHAAGVKHDGTLWTWGRNLLGELGTNDRINRSSPVQIIGSDWREVSVGFRHTAAIKTDGSMWLWGQSGWGELGDGFVIHRSSPVQVAGGGIWNMVSAGRDQTQAIRSDGALFSFGRNNFGQSGFGVSGLFASSPVQVAGGGTWQTVSAGYQFTAGIKTNGTLWMWGRNNFGQLGNGNVVNQISPVQVAGGGTWSDCSAGGNASAAIKSDGKMWTWGTNTFGELADEFSNSRSSPMQIGANSGLNNDPASNYTWRTVSIGDRHGLAIKTDGTLWGWGSNAQGQMGLGDPYNRLHMVPLSRRVNNNWKFISAGIFTSSAVHEGATWQ